MYSNTKFFFKELPSFFKREQKIAYAKKRIQNFTLIKHDIVQNGRDILKGGYRKKGEPKGAKINTSKSENYRLFEKYHICLSF